MNPLQLMGALVALYFGWTMFADGPLAFFVSSGLFVVFICASLAYDKGREWWPVCLFGAVCGLLHSTCGLMYVADGRSAVCDKGTGLPISALVLAGGAALTAHYARKMRNGRATSPPKP